MGKYLIESGSVAVKCILREERYEKGFKMEQQIICGTAGKVWTLIQMRVIETSKIRVFVLDEAPAPTLERHARRLELVLERIP